MKRWSKKIISTIEHYDFILMDSSFIDDIVVGERQDLCRTLYDLRCFTELEGFKESFKKLHYELIWKLEDVVRRENVFTVSEVVDEIINLKDIFSEAYGWHRNNFKMVVSADSLSFNLHMENNRVSLKRTRFFRKRIIENLRENGEELKSLNGSFELLNCLIIDLNKIVKNLKIYRNEGEIEPHFSVPEASKTDYTLVNAAIDYSIINPPSKIGIISSDKHIWQIRNRNYLDTCFDVIHLNNYTKLSKCSLN